MNFTDLIPHGIIVAFGSVIGYVFNEHTKRDDARFDMISATLSSMSARQITISDTMGSNHAEVLKVILESEQRR